MKERLGSWISENDEEEVDSLAALVAPSGWQIPLTSIGGRRQNLAVSFMIRLPMAFGLILLLSSCGGLQTSGSYDEVNNPLDSPGSQRRGGELHGEPKYPRGSYVDVIDANAGLFIGFPDEDTQAARQLALGTPLKVIGERRSYLRVETAEGEIGFVPAIMVSESSASRGVIVIENQAPAGGVPEGTGEAPAASFPESGAEGPFVAPEPEVPPISVE